MNNSFHKRIETFVAGNNVMNDGNAMPVLDVKVGHTWVVLTVEWLRGQKKIRAPKGTLLRASYPTTPPGEAVLDAAARAAFSALADAKSRFAPAKGITWGDLDPREQDAYGRLAGDMLIGKHRPASDEEEQQALDLVEDVVVAVARSKGWAGR